MGDWASQICIWFCVSIWIYIRDLMANGVWYVLQTGAPNGHPSGSVFPIISVTHVSNFFRAWFHVHFSSKRANGLFHRFRSWTKQKLFFSMALICLKVRNYWLCELSMGFSMNQCMTTSTSTQWICKRTDKGLFTVCNGRGKGSLDNSDSCWQHVQLRNREKKKRLDFFLVNVLVIHAKETKKARRTRAP